MPKRQRLQGWLGLIFFPVWWVLGVARYARLQPTWPRKIGLFLTFTPLLLFYSLIWLGALTVASGVLLDVVHYGRGNAFLAASN